MEKIRQGSGNERPFFLTVSFADHTAAGTLHHFFAPLGYGIFIVSILFLAVVPSLVTALTSNYTLSKIEASRISGFTKLSTIVSIAAGVIFLEEEVTLYHLNDLSNRSTVLRSMYPLC
jgi:drug/metabolite transporter (DMT)-like permease